MYRQRPFTITTIKAKPGGTVTVKMTYKGAWMNGFVYVDWDNDGQFTPDIVDNRPTEESELMSYTYLNGYNSQGSQTNGNSVANGVITCPTFTIPDNTQPGIYRMRLKVDWDSDDAGGNNNPNNLITANGGAVVDVLLNVHAAEVPISANQLNGDVLRTDGTALSDALIPFGDAFRIKIAPAPNFTYTGIVLTHGYNLDGPEYVRDNRQYSSVMVPASAFDDATHEYVIPASYIDGEVRIEGLFTPGTTTEVGAIRNDSSGAVTYDVYSIDGKRLSHAPEKGLYVMHASQTDSQPSQTRKILSSGR